MYNVLLFLMLFLQFPSAQDYYKMESPAAELQRAEKVIVLKQKAVEDAIKAESDWAKQIKARQVEKQDLIDRVMKHNNLDASWNWDDTLGKFVQKK